jgi:hypothetical protein
MTEKIDSVDGNQILNHQVPRFKVGQTVVRYIEHQRPMMEMMVDKIEGGLVHCSAKVDRKYVQIPGLPEPPAEGSWITGWTFDEESGIEEDEDLQWGRKYGQTGSWIEPKEASDDEVGVQEGEAQSSTGSGSTE